MNGAIGVDEVGRGAWAGPLLIVAARQKTELPEVKDSKLLTRFARERLLDAIQAACDLGEGWVMPVEIDRLGLSEAMRIGTERALNAIGAKANERIIFDGNINYCDSRFYRSSPVIKADDLFPIVSAASIYAKVTRDQYMAELPERYAVYEFDRHVGYGTARHRTLLMRYGICDLHRLSFKPVQALA